MPWGLLLDALSLFLVLSYGLSAVLAIAPPPSGNILDREHTARRRLFAPPALALLAVAMGFWPALRSVLFGIPDHCLAEAAHHPHLCWLHLEATPEGGMVHDAAALGTLTVLVVVAARQVFQWGQAHGRFRLLRTAALPEREQGVRDTLTAMGATWNGAISVVAFGAPLCFVRGVRQPHLVVSTAVLDDLTLEEAKAVLAHEVAHVTRRDNLWRVIGQAALLGHLPVLGRRAFERWVLAAESACDESAAVTISSHIAVAEALVRFQRLLNRHVSVAPLGASFGTAGTLEARVKLLLDPPTVSRWHYAWRWMPLLLLPLALWQLDTVHGLLEGLLDLLHH
jgi:Zn-dependent protease with chaperone function